MLQNKPQGEVMTEREQRAVKADRNIRIYVKEAEKNFLQIGMVLSDIESESLYEDLGYKSFKAYISSPEIGFSLSLANKMKDNYRKFIVFLNCNAESLINVGSNRLTIIKPHISFDNKDELLSVAAALSPGDLKREMTDRFGKAPTKEFVDWKNISRGFADLLRQVQRKIKDNGLQQVFRTDLDAIDLQLIAYDKIVQLDEEGGYE